MASPVDSTCCCWPSHSASLCIVQLTIRICLIVHDRLAINYSLPVLAIELASDGELNTCEVHSVRGRKGAIELRREDGSNVRNRVDASTVGVCHQGAVAPSIFAQIPMAPSAIFDSLAQHLPLFVCGKFLIGKL